MRGEKITITRSMSTGTDAFGMPVSVESTEIVDDVLIAPGSEQNSSDSTHPEGITVAYTLYFPRSWQFNSLRGALITIDDIDYTVIGDPRPYKGGVQPTRWNLVVQVSDRRG